MTDLDAMEARLRELWAVTQPRSALAAEDRVMADKLLGKTDAARLAATKRGARFRYRPQAIQKIEYHWVPAGGSMEHHEAGWTIEATQNGVRRILGRLLPADRCAIIVSELKRRGYRVVLTITEGMKAAGVTTGPAPARSPASARYAPGKPQPSRRAAILQSLKDFRP